MLIINVLSLFDGISCGQIALERAGIPVEEYHSFEIDDNAIKVTQTNYPQTIQHGTVEDYDFSKFLGIDLLIGGSPCQGFSSAGKGLNFDDPRSKLFFEYVRALKTSKPRYFLLENVNMLPEWRDRISNLLGVEPVLINSKLVSAQDRKRLYWTNIPNVRQPADKGIGFENVSCDGWVCGSIRGRRINAQGHRDDYNKDIHIRQYIECRKDNKTNCITTVCKDNVAVPYRCARIPAKGVTYRFLTAEECEQLQTIPVGYTACVPDTVRKKLIGNAWTVDVIAHILRKIKLTF